MSFLKILNGASFRRQAYQWAGYVAEFFKRRFLQRRLSEHWRINVRREERFLVRGQQCLALELFYQTGIY